MEIPIKLKNKLDTMIACDDPDFPNILEEYKDFKNHCEQLIERETDPDKLIDLQNKRDLYSSIIDYIEDKTR